MLDRNDIKAGAFYKKKRFSHIVINLQSSFMVAIFIGECFKICFRMQIASFVYKVHLTRH